MHFGKSRELIIEYSSKIVVFGRDSNKFLEYFCFSWILFLQGVIDFCVHGFPKSWDGSDKCGSILLQILGKGLDAGVDSTAALRDGCILHCPFENMPGGEDGEPEIVVVKIDNLWDDFEVMHNIFMREYHPFWLASRTGGIDNSEDIITFQIKIG